MIFLFWKSRIIVGFDIIIISSTLIRMVNFKGTIRCEVLRFGNEAQFTL